GAMPGPAEAHCRRLKLVALVHHPLAAEAGLEPAVAKQLAETERRALAAARLVIVTSPPTAADVIAYGVDEDRVAVVEPGTDPAPLASGSREATVHLLCVATLIPRKGHAVLFRALALLSKRNWKLTCVGS